MAIPVLPPLLQPFRRGASAESSFRGRQPPSSAGSRISETSLSSDHQLINSFLTPTIHIQRDNSRRSSIISMARSAISKKRMSIMSVASTTVPVTDQTTFGLHIEPPHSHGQPQVSVTRQLAFGHLDNEEDMGGWRPRRCVSQPCVTTIAALAIVAAFITGILCLRFKEDEIDQRLKDMWMSKYPTTSPIKGSVPEEIFIYDDSDVQLGHNVTGVNGTGSLIMQIIHG